MSFQSVKANEKASEQTCKQLNVAKMRKQFEEVAETNAVPVRPQRRNRQSKRITDKPLPGTLKNNMEQQPDPDKNTVKSDPANGYAVEQSATGKKSSVCSSLNAKLVPKGSDTSLLSVAERMKVFQSNLKNPANKPNHLMSKPKKTALAPAHRHIVDAERLANPLGISPQLPQLSEKKCSNFRKTSVTSSASSMGNPPPLKPPRTFAHDIYVTQKKLMPVSDSANKSSHVPKCINGTSSSDASEVGEFSNASSVSSFNHPPSNNVCGAPLDDKLANRDITTKCSISSMENKVSHKPKPPIRPKKMFASNSVEASPYSVSPVSLGSQFITVENSFYQSAGQPKSGCRDDLAMPSKGHSRLRRSYSDEHIYSEPYEVLPGAVNPRDNVGSGNTSPRDHHYMNIPIITQLQSRQNEMIAKFSSPPLKFESKADDPSRPKKLLGPTIRDMINHSFSLLRCHLSKRDSISDDVKMDEKDDSGSEVSVKDVQERIIYVNSVKKLRLNASAGSSHERRCINNLFKLLILADVEKIGSQFQAPRTVIRFPKLQPLECDWAILEHLCFPDFGDCRIISNSSGREDMLFIFCDEKGEKTYGHCLRLNKMATDGHQPVSLCLLSCMYAPTFYFQILDELSKNIDVPKESWLTVLSELHQLQPPSPGDSIVIPIQNNTDNSNVKITRSPDLQMENAPVTRLLQLLDIELLLKVIASLILERRVLLLGSSFDTLSQCCKAIIFLLYPFTWQHMVIPMLPECLLSEICTLSPYLMGVSRTLREKVCEMLEDEILIVDVDNGCTIREVGDENTILPGKIQRALETALSLAKNMTDPTETLRDVMISEAFVRMFVETVGHYSDFIVQKPDKTQYFQKEAFCKFPSSQGIQIFLQWFTETQMFESFISDCLFKKKHLLVLEEWKVLPLHSQLQSSLFDRRALEYKDIMQGTPGLRNNLKEFGLKVRNLGMKLKKALE